MKSEGEFVETILSRINIPDTNELAEAVEYWGGARGGASLPDDPRRQKGMDMVSRARLMATAQKESGAWLNDLPVSSLGTLLDYESFRVAIALRVDADICVPHSCLCCRGWTIESCMAYPSNTVLAANFQAIQQ